MRKKKILFTITMFTKNGGSCAVLLNMINCMDMSKYDITICSVFDNGIKPNIPESVRIIYLFKVRNGLNDELKKKTWKAGILGKIYYLFNHLFPKQLFYNFKTRGKFDYEVAYEAMIQYKLVANSSHHCKKIGWVQTDITQEPKCRSFYNGEKDEARTIGSFDRFVFCSDTAKEGFVKLYGFREKCQTIYNFNEVDKIKALSEEGLDLEAINKPLLVTVGRLVYEKGYDRLLEAIKILMGEGYTFETWIIGNGENETDLKKYIQENGLEKYVKMLGFQGNPYKYIKKCSWFIAPSRYEGLSTVVSCAYILGKPVMATNCSGMSELLDKGRVGVLVNNDLSGVVEGLKTILDMSGVEYGAYLDKAKEWADFFSVESRLKEIDELFNTR